MLSKFSTVANLSYSDVLNSALLTDKATGKFGVKKETMTSVLTSNKKDKTLTPTGDKLVYLINLILPDHIK